MTTWTFIITIWCVGSIVGGLLTGRWIRSIEENELTRKEKTR